MSQMIFSGRRAATSGTKSPGPFSSTSSTIRSATACTWSSKRWTIRGENARDTIRRILACRGSSMLIIEPKYSFRSAGMSAMLMALSPEQKSAGRRDASMTSAWLTSA